LGIVVAAGAALGLGLAELVLFVGLGFGLVAFFFLALELWMVCKAVESFRSERRSAGDGT
jgi:Na+-transporting methylmalonyl-CoA/oxaloacetate decarboxylase gamma subunit